MLLSNYRYTWVIEWKKINTFNPRVIYISRYTISIKYLRIMVFRYNSSHSKRVYYCNYHIRHKYLVSWIWKCNLLQIIRRPTSFLLFGLLLEQYKLYNTNTHTALPFSRFVISWSSIIIQSTAYQLRLPSTKITEKKTGHRHPRRNYTCVCLEIYWSGLVSTVGSGWGWIQ